MVLVVDTSFQFSPVFFFSMVNAKKLIFATITACELLSGRTRMRISEHIVWKKKKITSREKKSGKAGNEQAQNICFPFIRGKYDSSTCENPTKVIELVTTAHFQCDRH